MWHNVRHRSFSSRLVLLLLPLFLIGSFTLVANTVTNTRADLSTCGATSIGGTVFRDYNNDGVYADPATAGVTDYEEAPLTSHVDQVTINAYDENNTVIATAQTDVDGDFVLTGLNAGEPYRIELDTSTLESWVSAAGGNESGAFTQIVETGNCGVEIATNAGDDYCQYNPELSVPCFAAGEHVLISGNVNDPAVISFHNQSAAYDADLTEPGVQIHPVESVIGDTGIVYGQATDPINDVIYVSAYAKKHAVTGPADGSNSNPYGSIYRIDRNTAAATLLTNDGGGNGTINAGSNSRFTSHDPNNDGTYANWSSADWFRDYDSWYDIGNIGFGDMDISDDLTTLYTINLFDRSLYIINATTGAVNATVAVPVPSVPGCAIATDWKPFAVTVHDGKVFVGGICSAESTGVDDDLSAHIQTYDIDNASFDAAEALMIAMDSVSYPRDDMAGGIGNTPDTLEWNAWNSQRPGNEWWIKANNHVLPNSPNRQTTNPQPFFGGIDFDGEDLVITLGDRWGDQTAALYFNATPSDPTHRAPATYFDSGERLGSIAEGDILRACFDRSAGAWVLENNGTCNGITTVNTGQNSLNDGPGGSEYYWGEEGPQPGRSHQENAFSSIAQIPGSAEVSYTALGPDYVGATGGVSRLNHETGGRSRAGYNVYTGSANVGLFGKTNGLGDLDHMCLPPPLTIGNRVWVDANNNGIQDPWYDGNGNGSFDVGEEEGGLGGITINLYEDFDNNGTADGPVIATAVTNANGYYSFEPHSSATMDADNPELTGWEVDDPDPTAGDEFGIVPGGLQFGQEYLVRIDTNAGIGGEVANTLNDLGGSYSLTSASGAVYTLTTADNGSGSQPEYHDSDAVAAAVTAIEVATGSLGSFGESRHNFDIGLIGADLGDAPDAVAGAAAGDYQTTGADGGPSHGIDRNLLLGTEVDADAGLAQNITASADDDNGVDDEDGITNPAQLFMTDGDIAPSLDVVATNATGTPATLYAWVDYNGDGVFDNTTERSSVGVPSGTNGTVTLNLPNVPVTAHVDTTGVTYLRLRLAPDADPASDPTGAVGSGEVEDYPVYIDDGTGEDYADMPDPAAGTAAGDYQTTLVDDGPRHTRTSTMRLGQRIDSDTGTLQDVNANADDSDGLDDEDGVVDVNQLSIADGQVGPQIEVQVSNAGATPATLYGWIDYNGDGVFDNTTERTDIMVAAGVVNQIVPLTFPDVPAAASADTGGLTYMLLRLSDDTAAQDPTGLAATGEAESYPISVQLPHQIGNLIFEDNNNNGVFDGSDAGIDGVEVHLYRDSDSSGDFTSGTDTLVATTSTAGGGLYLFDSIPAGDFMVYVPDSEFQPSEPLAGFISSTGALGAATGPYEPAPDPDDDADNDDNGSVSGMAVATAPVTISDGGEPTSEDGDDDTNLTVDLGFFSDLSLGNLVWDDYNGNGVVDSGEPGISGVTVQLHVDSNVNGSYDAGTDVLLATTTTDSSGAYQFSGLGDGDYIVSVPSSDFTAGQPLRGYRSSSGSMTDLNGAYDGGLGGTASGGLPQNEYLHFDSRQSDFVDLNNLDLPASTSAFTMEARIYSMNMDDCANGGQSECRIIDKSTGSQDNEHLWALSTYRTGFGEIRLRVHLRSGGVTTVFEATSGDMLDDTWYHVAAVYDGSTIETFVDGVSTGSGVMTGAIDTDPLALTSLGNRSDRLRDYNGRLDEVRLWNTARTAAELLANKDDELTGAEAGLYAYYRMNDGSGQAAADSGPNGFNGRLGSTVGVDSDDPTWRSATSAPNAGYLTFDGSNDEVDLNNLDLPVGSTALTLETWVRPGDFDACDGADECRIIGKSTNQNNGSQLWSLGLDGISVLDARVRFWISTSDGSRNFTATGGELQDNTWHHVAAVYDGVNMIVYLDGVNVGSVTHSGTVDTDAAALALLGSRNNGTHSFNGDMDEVRIWNVARTATEISDNMFSQLSGSEAGLIAYYQADEASGQVLTDITVNGNDGTLGSSTAVDANDPAWNGLSAGVGGNGYGPTDPDDDIDNDDDGNTQSNGDIASFAVTLSQGAEPTSEDGNPDTNTTLDLGFVRTNDYGDAPDAAAGSAVGDYQTTETDAGPNHQFDANLYLGARVDGDDGTLQNAGATADDLDGNGDPSDEDGIVNVAQLEIADNQINPTIDVEVTNTTGAAATLYGWIDYNGDGVFDNTTERASVAVATGVVNSAVSLVFANVPATASLDTVGATFLRLRISSDAAAADPINAAVGGEAEDHAMTVVNRDMTLGDRVFADTNNNGLFDPTESGIDGVAVELYYDTDSSVSYTAGDTLVTTTTTAGGGLYDFTGLAEGEYIVVVPATEFAAAGVLEEYISSSGSGVFDNNASGPYEIAADPDNDINDDDNGSMIDGAVASFAVTMEFNNEPTDDGDADDTTNLSVDFGFYKPLIYLTLDLTDDTMDLGVLNPNLVNSTTQEYILSTNNASGATLHFVSDGDLRNGPETINATADGAVTAGTEEYGFSLSGGVDLSLAAPYDTGDNAWPTTNTLFATAAGPVDGAGLIVDYKASMDGNTGSGDYNQTITVTAVANP